MFSPPRMMRSRRRDGEVETSALHAPDVTGAQPTTGADHLGRRLGAAPVAGHHHRPPHVDLSLFAVRQDGTQRVADLELHGRQRPAGRLREAVELLAAVQGRERGALGLAVADAHRAAQVRQRLLGPALQRGRERGAAAAAAAQRGQVVALRRGMAHDAVQHRRGVRPVRDPVALDERHDRLGVELADGPDRAHATDQVRDRGHVQTRHVEQRRRDELARRATRPGRRG